MMGELKTWTAEAIDNIDASIFTGDEFSDPDARAKLREYLARFERGLKEFDRADAEPGVEEHEVCNRNGCEGIMVIRDVVGCTCINNPPCSACVDNHPECNECGESQEDD